MSEPLMSIVQKFSRWDRKTPKERFENLYLPDPNSGCWLWIGSAYKNGYGSFGDAGRNFYAHRYSWTLFRGPIPEGINVCHVCDVRPCVNPNHLFLGTHQINMRDMVQKGRHYNKGPGIRAARGENAAQAKLDAEKVIKIRADTRGPSAVAKDYGVSRRLIGAIRLRQIWKHVP